MTVFTPDTLMKRVSSLVQLGQLTHDALAVVSIILGRWMAGCPIPLREVDRYLPCSPRTTRRLMAQLRSLDLVSTSASANRCLLALPGCTMRIEQPATTSEPQPQPVPPEPPPTDPSREPYVPIKPPSAWHDVLVPERPHVVRKSMAPSLSKALAKHSPDEIDPSILGKVEAAKYPAAYLATLVTPAGDLKDHVRVGKAKPTKAATTSPKSKPAPETQTPQSQQETPICLSKFAAIREMLAEQPSQPTYRRL